MDTIENINKATENATIQPSLPKDGILYTWGKNASGCLANKKEEQGENVPYKVQTNQRFIQVSTGGFFGAAISKANELYTWGDTKNGRSGQPQNQSCVMIPQKINNLQNIISVSCGNWHCLALNNSYQLYVTGHNKYGACGYPGKEEITSFTLNDTVQGLKITTISAGDGFSLYLDTGKTVYSSGFRLRHGNKEEAHQQSIKQIQNLKGIAIKSISAGYAHAAVVSEESGEVYTWGTGEFHQLGHGNTKSIKTPQKIPNLNGIEQVSCSRGEKNCHTMATTATGQVYTWGSGYKGKLGHDATWTHEDPADESRPRMVKFFEDKGIQVVASISGGIHNAVLTKDRKIMTFGCGSDGRLGHPEVAKYVYLYREALPREIEGPFKDNQIIDVSSSYYFMAAIAEK